MTAVYRFDHPHVADNFQVPSADGLFALQQLAISAHGPRRDAIDLYRERANRDAWVERPELQRFVENKDAWTNEHRDALVGTGVEDYVATRADALGPAGGLFLPRQLEHIYRKVLEEKRPALNAMRLFPVDSEVPVGARNHTVRRFLQYGEAKIHRGSNVDIPGASAAQIEEQFPVRFAVTSVKIPVFELLAARFANVDMYGAYVRAARRAFDTLANQLFWAGSAEDGLYGILNYPYLPKKIVSTSFVPGASTGDQIVAAISAILNYANDYSRQTFSSNRLAISPRVDTMIKNTRMGSVDTTTIKKFILDNNPGLVIEVVHELQGAGPGGLDGILAYNDSADSISLVMPQGLTALPVQYREFDQFTPMYGSIGGVVMRDVGNNLLAWVTAA